MIQVRLTHYTFSGVKNQTNGQRILFKLRKKFFRLAREKLPCLEKTTAYIINIGLPKSVIKYMSNAHVEHVGVQCSDLLPLSETCFATLDHRGTALPGQCLPCGRVCLSVCLSVLKCLI